MGNDIARFPPIAAEPPDPPAGNAIEATIGRRGNAYAIRGATRANWTPGWRAVLLEGRILLKSPTSAGWYAWPLPAVRSEADRRIYANDQVEIALEPGACAIPHYRATLPDRVTLAWDSGRFEGCGGPRQVPAQMEGTVWELIRIDLDPAPSGRSPAVTLEFGSDGSLGGTLACNNGGIRSSWTGAGGFVHRGGGFEQTAMGCNQALAEAYGQRFWAAMAGATGWRRSRERLRITFADESEADLRLLL